MEIIINKIYETVFFKNPSLSIKERLAAILIGLGPLILVTLYFINHFFF